MKPCLKLLTGDAIFAQRPLLEALQEYHCDYLFQVKDNGRCPTRHCRCQNQGRTRLQRKSRQVPPNVMSSMATNLQKLVAQFKLR
ncbi:MAG: transposase [Planctomycetaceae bacterium]|nr:transposase [Planctomycetaceae bacterium]